MNTLLLTALLYLANGNPDYKSIVTINLMTQEKLMGVNIISLQSDNTVYTSNLNGRIQLSDKQSDQPLILKYTGYESIVISTSELLSLDTIFMNASSQNQTLGTTGIQPINIVNFYISDKPRTKRDYIKVELKSIRQLQIEERESNIKQFMYCLNELTGSTKGRLLVSFSVDAYGDVKSFQISQLEFTIDGNNHSLFKKIKETHLITSLNFGKLSNSGTARGNINPTNYTIPLD